MSFKVRLMEMVWRVQQAQMIISIIFWAMTMALLLYPYVREAVLDDLIGSEHVAVGILLVFLVVLFSIVAFGLVYDRLRFWRELMVVISERNPYLYHGKMSPKEIVTWSAYAYPTRENMGRLRNMIDYNLKDPAVIKALEEAERRQEMG